MLIHQIMSWFIFVQKLQKGKKVRLQKTNIRLCQFFVGHVSLFKFILCDLKM